MPKVSVLMPVYKTNESYLREAIESILNQTFSDFEFLILDDCPDDNREEIVKSYKDKRIRYSKNEKNLGITASRNKLIEMAKGEYLAVFDHDDISLPERFSKQVDFLDKHHDIGVIGCNIKTIVTHKISNNPINDSDIKLALIKNCVVTHPASMIRKSVLIENNIRYEEKFSPSEDYALWCRLIPHTKFYNIPEVLFHYRDHLENTSHKQQDRMHKATLAIWSFVKLDNPVLYDEYVIKSDHVTKIKLFGFFTLIKTVKKENITKVYLFGSMLLLSIKTATRLRNK